MERTEKGAGDAPGGEAQVRDRARAPLRALMIEDSNDDAALVLREFSRGGYDVEHRRVQSGAELQRALDDPWDVILSDYSLPGFDGLAALRVVQAREIDLPFIIISGEIGEEIAVSLMKAGAHDYVMKDNLARLVPAVRRELREAEERRARRAAECERQEFAQRLRVLSAKLLEAQEAERRNIACELHDEIGQRLTALKLSLQAARRVVPEDARAPIDDCLAIADTTLGQVRELSLNLRPSVLDDFGLVAALRWLLARQSERAGFRAQLVCADEGLRLPRSHETTLFRVAQEAVTNVVRHAKASEVRIELTITDSAVELSVRDDGSGFDYEAARRAAAGGRSIGLLGMEERVALAGGQFLLQSRAGQGTTVRARLPLAADSGG